ncbi:MAG: acyl-CoA dehydrogenase [Betaproteobacteria bacterium]|nr:acyl-CoA dehydrogenase [Betaproteobacteria bacterium]
MVAASTPTQKPSLSQWLGRQESQNDSLTIFPANALAATLNLSPAFAQGDVLPALWHWLYFLPCAKQSELGRDGHAHRGGFLPPVSLPRRMWAGGDLRWHRPLRLGAEVRRVSSIQGIAQKQGKSGELVFVKVLHEISDDAGLAMQEVHDIVYRGHSSPAGSSASSSAIQLAGIPQFSRRLVPDSVLLFRYSALTFNGHRIHYDRRYTMEDEGYEGLVVHGPLVATLLAELLREQKPGATWLSFTFRALLPMIEGQPLKLCGRAIDESLYELWAENGQGAVTMTASAAIQHN